MRPLLLLLALALPAFAQEKQIVVEAGSVADSEGALRMVPPMGHTEGVFSAVLSPRGDMLLTASGDHTARLWDVASGREVRTLPMKCSAYSAVFSPDGRRALVGSGCLDCNLYLWDVASGRVLHEMQHPNDVTSITFSADGHQALTGCDDGLVRVWNLESGELVRELDADPAQTQEPGNRGAPQSVAFSTDGKKAVAVTQDNRLTQHNVVTGKLLSSQKLPFTPAALRPDGQFAGGSTEDAFVIWDVGAARESARFEMPNTKFCAASIGTLSPDGKLAAAGTDKGDLFVWDIATRRLLASWRGHKDSVFGLKFSDDSASLVSAGFDKAAHLWSVPGLGDAARRDVRTFRGYSLPIENLLISPDARSMLASTFSYSFSNNEGTNTLQLSDIATGRRLRFWQVPGLPRAMVFSRDSRRVLVSSAAPGNEKPRLFLFDVASDEPVREYKGFTQDIHALAFSSDNRQFLGGGSEGILRVWNVDDANPIASMTGAKKSIVNVMWSKDGTSATSLDNEGLARVWDIRAQRQIKQWTFAEPDEKGEVSAYDKTVFSADGRLLLSGAGIDKQTKPDGELDWRNVLRVFDAESGKLIRVLGKATNFANSTALSDDGKWAITSDVNERVTQVWDVEAGHEVTQFKEAKNAVTSIALAPDGRSFFTVHSNGSIAVRDLQSGSTRLTYLAMENGDWMAFTPDGLFDGSQGGIERVTFEKNGKTFALEQFAERFFRPGLVHQVMAGIEGDNAGATAPEASAGALLAQGAPPTVKITSPQNGAAGAGQIEVSIEAKAQDNGGVKAIRLYHNGRLVGGPGQLRGIVVEAAPQMTAGAGGTKTQKFTVSLTPGDNVLRAVAYSQTDLESKPDEVKITFASGVQKPALHVLAVGINQYRDATMTLTYARPDAESLVQFFKEPKNTTLFSSANVTPLFDEAATGEAIKKSLGDLAAQSKPEDVVFIYMAGHGETAAPTDDGDDDPNISQGFYFLPSEMHSMIMKKRVRELGLSGAEINALIAKIPARKIVLVYDACKSGAAVEGASRGAGDEEQALASLARSQGIYVLTASTAQQYAGEVKALGHGILTYALLEGLGGKAAGADSIVKVSGLFAYADDRVPALAKEYRGREQWPVSFGKGQNFPLVMKP